MIFVECHNDYSLVEYLELGEIEYSGTKSKVISDVLNYNATAIGIVDEDPNSNDTHLLSNFKLIDQKIDIRLYILKFYT